MKNKITWKEIFNEFEIYIGTVVFVVLTVLLAIQVVSRFLLNHAFTWAEELAVIMFVWLIYLGVAGAVTNRKHLRIDALINVMPFKAKRVLLILRLRDLPLQRADCQPGRQQREDIPDAHSQGRSIQHCACLPGTDLHTAVPGHSQVDPRGGKGAGNLQTHH